MFNGSIGGGGRYDNLIEKWTKEKIPSCGISIGFERIINIMIEDFDDLNTKKTVYSVIDDIDIEKKKKIFESALSDRKNGKIINIINQAKNKKFQRETLEKFGYDNFIDY